MSADSLSPFVSIREGLVRLQLVECRMAHERVRVEQGQVVRQCADGAEDVLVRQPLCRREIRAQRLACGHTTARDQMGHVLVNLRDVGALSADVCAALRAELQAIGDDVHSLDHRKGDAEKRHALLEDAHQPAEAAAAVLRALEREHDGHVERLRDWRDRVLHAIDHAADHLAPTVAGS